jgi:hypothetical protein
VIDSPEGIHLGRAFPYGAWQEGVDILNNTIVDCDTGISTLRVNGFDNIDGPLRIHNNIITSDDPNAVAFALQDGTVDGDMVADFNDLDTATAAVIYSFDPEAGENGENQLIETYTTLADWQAATYGLDANSIAVDPALDAEYYPTAAAVIDGGSDDALSSDLIDPALATDFAGDPRVDGDAVDMGALETSAFTAMAGDADEDGDVDATDLATLGMNWSPNPAGLTWAQGDFDGDGDVDATDLATLGMNWEPGGYDPVPEPASIALLSLGGLALLRRRSR